uniref:Uncharacterized protein n=1 Tax=Macaca mulatta TaxID=9544 RepID=A0A5F8AGV9_MACMU
TNHFPATRDCHEEELNLKKKKIESYSLDWVQWLTPVNPALWEAEAGSVLEPQSLKPAWAHGKTPSVPKKKKKITWVWGCMPIVPATQEAEVERLLEPRSLKLLRAVVTPLHSSLGDRVRPCLKNKKKQKKNYTLCYPCLYKFKNF